MNEYGGEGTGDFEQDLQEEQARLQNGYPTTLMVGSAPETKTFTGYQLVETPKGKELKYNFEYRFDETIKKFRYTRFEVENHGDFFSPPKKFSTSQTEIAKNPKILEMKDDPNSATLKTLFFDYMQAIIETEKKVLTESQKSYAYWAKAPLELINYVKGNFTNSGQDEYLVFFKQGAYEGMYEYDNYIRHGRCFVVSENKIVKNYRVPVSQCIAEDSSKLKNFAAKFFQGWVGDFNKNGTSEVILIGSELAFGANIVEFENGAFKTNFLMDFTYNPLSLDYDWDREEFTCEYFAPVAPIRTPYRATIKWSPQENCYIRVSNEVAN